MIDQNKARTALIIQKTRHDQKYLENNFFFKNATDTFQVLNRINAIDHRLINSSLLAHIAKFLISLEIKPGGPYSENGKDIDHQLNTEIAIFLKSQGIELPNLEPFTTKTKIKKENSEALEQINRLIEKSLKPLPNFFQIIIKSKIEKIIKSDKDKQILLLAHFFKLSLGNIGVKIAPETIYELGAANLFLWLSYSIYDDLIDKDLSPDSLPIANWAAREFVTYINKQESSNEYQILFKKIMAKMDYSQLWENKYARFSPNKKIPLTAKINTYQKPSSLYSKSLAHSLGPMLMLDQLNYKANSIDGKSTLLFFKYYLSVRQLQDDIYDFKIDYQKGIITSANIRIIKNGVKFDQLTNYFIKKELPRLNAKIIKYQKMAEEHLKAAKIIKYPNYLHQFLLPLKANPEEIKDFLNVYKKINNQPSISQQI